MVRYNEGNTTRRHHTSDRGFTGLGLLKKVIFAAFLTAIAVVNLPGCLRITADELYSLPQVSEEYLKLQASIDSVLNLGAEFSPPASGPNRQTVQLKDLNGDGVDEAIVFFSEPGDSALKLYIFEVVDGDYVVAEVIEGVGTAFESVRYVDMSGDGVSEIVVGWQMSPALKHMSIFSIKDFHSILLASSEYTWLTVYDLTGDGSDDVIALRLPSNELGAVAEVFNLMPDGEIVSSEARLSIGIETISRVLTGRLVDNVPALFVESEGSFEDGGLVTDICIYQDGSFTNISAQGAGGISEGTVRTHMLSSDINSDGTVEVPMPRRLKAQSETAYYAIDWYVFDSAGQDSLTMTTYHNISDEWFLILPFDWRGKVSVRREDSVPGERTVIFSYIAGEDGPYEDFLKIYKLSGDRGEEQARLPGRVKLLSEGAAVYAFEMLAEPNSFGLTFYEALIKENFRLIYPDWLAGS